MDKEKQVISKVMKIVMFTPINKYNEDIKVIVDDIKKIVDAECEWSSDNDGVYNSKCGYSFMFSDDRDNATDYGFEYCPSCGNRIYSAT
jgi:hypothetical protein